MVGEHLLDRPGVGLEGLDHHKVGNQAENKVSLVQNEVQEEGGQIVVETVAGQTVVVEQVVGQNVVREEAGQIVAEKVAGQTVLGMMVGQIVVAVVTVAGQIAVGQTEVQEVAGQIVVAVVKVTGQTVAVVKVVGQTVVEIVVL